MGEEEEEWEKVRQPHDGAHTVKQAPCLVSYSCRSFSYSSTMGNRSCDFPHFTDEKDEGRAVQ